MHPLHRRIAIVFKQEVAPIPHEAFIERIFAPLGRGLRIVWDVVAHLAHFRACNHPTMCDDLRGLNTASRSRKPKLFDRKALNLDVAARCRLSDLKDAWLNLIRLKICRLVRVQALINLHRRRVFFLPIDLSHPKATNQTILDPIVNQRKALIFRVQDVVDVIVRLRSLLVIVLPFWQALNNFLAAKKHPHERRHGSIDHFGNVA